MIRVKMHKQGGFLDQMTNLMQKATYADVILSWTMPLASCSNFKDSFLVVCIQ